MNSSLDRLAREIGNGIEDELLRSGIFHRIFIRAKTEESIEKKLALKDYANSSENKIMQDVIGIRITMYFEDDLSIVYNVLKKKTSYFDETKDETKISVFEPERINLIFKLNEEQSREITDLVIQKYKYIDTTYEVQLRTVLSEGWHEVEHDLRYKCKEDWNQYADISHIFNGIYASLVTSDWSILSLFENLSYKHYKAKNWSAMLRNKFRLRFISGNLSNQILDILNLNPEIGKELYKIDRNEFMQKIVSDNLRIPFTLTNLLFILNAYYLKNEEIKNLAPDFIVSNRKLYKE